MPTGQIGTAASTNFGTRNNRYQPGILPGHSAAQDFILGRGDVDPTRFADAFGVDLYQAGLDEIGTQQAIGARAEQAGLLESTRIRDETEARREETLGYLTDEQKRASQETISQQTLDRLFAGKADQAALDAQNLIGAIRSHLGQSGVRGGAAAGMAAGVELQRLGQLTAAQRDLSVFKAQADAQDRLNRWQRAFQIGDLMNQEPSAFLADALQNVQQSALVREGLIRQERAAMAAAKAQESAGEDALFGQVLGGVFGLAGSML